MSKNNVGVYFGSDFFLHINILKYILKVYTEGFVHLSVLAWFI